VWIIALRDVNDLFDFCLCGIYRRIINSYGFA